MADDRQQPTQQLSKTEIRLSGHDTEFALIKKDIETQRAHFDKALGFLQPGKLIGMLGGLVILIGTVGGWVYSGMANTAKEQNTKIELQAKRDAELVTHITRLQEQRRETADRVQALEWKMDRAAERIGALGTAPVQIRRVKTPPPPPLRPQTEEPTATLGQFVPQPRQPQQQFKPHTPPGPALQRALGLDGAAR